MAKIFLIDDNSDHALLMSRGLSEGGHEVKHFADGNSALDFFRNNPDASELPEFVMLDLKLPGVDGFEILRELRGHPKYRLIPVIVLTTSKYQQEINRAYELGASGFITKSEDFPELLAKLTSVKDYWLKAVERPKLSN